jgi:flagellar biosynthetic protein FliR
MSLFNFNEMELFTFFAVLVRISVLVAVLPFLGDKYVPVPVKILLSLAISVVVFPTLVSTGQIDPMAAAVWSSSAGGILGTVAMEAIFGLVLGFTAKLAFDAISFSGHLVGTFMGFAAASTYDPRQESQTGVVSEIQMSIAMLIFLALDGHHFMLRSAIDSFRYLGIGGVTTLGHATLGAAFSARLVDLTGQVIKLGIQLSAPVAVAMFGVNVAFAVMSKAMPQLNILVLSFAVSALVGLLVLFLSLPDYSGAVENIFSRIGDWMESMVTAIALGK